MIFVDSSVWIAYFRGSDTEPTETLHRLLGRDVLITGDLVLAEVLQGFERERDFLQARLLFSSLHVVHVGGVDIAIQSARNDRFLRQLGITVRKTIDRFIATRCIEGGFELLHDDRDFVPFVEHLGLKAVV